MNPVRASPCLDAALEYLAHGWAPIPLCPPQHEGCAPGHVANCQNPGKRPLIEWQTYQQRLPTEREVRLLFARYPGCNVGIVLGAVSRLVGVDIDGPEAEALFRELAGPLHPATFEFRTPGGGRRLLYEKPEGILISQRRFERGSSHVLILGEGTYTVMPPSTHPNGETYQCD